MVVTSPLIRGEFVIPYFSKVSKTSEVIVKEVLDK
jgi:hypothetical protein